LRTTRTPDTTVVTVNFGLAHLVLAQRRLMLASAREPWRLAWLVADNSPSPAQAATLAAHRIGTIHRTAEIARGASRARPDRSPRSTAHAAALNVLLRKVETRFVLVIDPDVLFMAREWDVVLRRRLDGRVIVGVPYHPTRPFKYHRATPTVTMFLADMSWLRRACIDFSPGRYPDLSSRRYASPWLNWLAFNSWRDTGWELAATCRRLPRRRWHAFDAPLTQSWPAWPPVAAPKRWLERVRTQAWQLRHAPERSLLEGGAHDRRAQFELHEEYYDGGGLLCVHLRGAAQRGLSDDSVEIRHWLAHAARRVGVSEHDLTGASAEPSP
jgi:hypothetical protein